MSVSPSGGAPEPSRAEALSEREETLFEHASLTEAERLTVSLDGYEGPIDLLLDMAKAQKVDLLKISVLALAEQYLDFVNAAKRLRIELAADYLVMAAWLAYLKSRLLLPKAPENVDPEEEDEEAKLLHRLKRREEMQRLAGEAEKLFERVMLGRDAFGRGEPERRSLEVRVAYDASLLDLLRAYAKTATRRNFQPLHLDRRRALVAIDEALLALRRALEDAGAARPGADGAAEGASAADWAALETYLPAQWRNAEYARSAIASTFSAALELCKHGRAEIRQSGAFEAVELRPRIEEERAAVTASAASRLERPSLAARLDRRSRGAGRGNAA